MINENQKRVFEEECVEFLNTFESIRKKPVLFTEVLGTTLIYAKTHPITKNDEYWLVYSICDNLAHNYCDNIRFGGGFIENK